MPPEYIRDELVLRLSSPRLSPRKLKAICRILEIDLDAALDPQPAPEEIIENLSVHLGEGPSYSGEVPFDFETRCGNLVRRVPGRIVYASAISAIGEIEQTVSVCHALTWAPWEPAPEWQPMPENALPDGLVQRLSEAVLDAVIEQQRLSKDNQRD
jgi:hypothetical protein